MEGSGKHLERRQLLLIAASLFIVLITVGPHFFPFPLSLNIVWGFSMYPSLKPADMVISASTKLVSYSPGDVVIYCPSAFHCIIHRVMSINESTVITKGDFNPIPDPPVRPSEVEYRVLLSIPAWLWISLLMISISLSYVDLRNLKRSLLSEFSLEAFLYIMVLLALMLTFVLVILQSPGRAAEISAPQIFLRSAVLTENKTAVMISYSTHNLSLLRLLSCSVGTSSLSSPCEGIILNGTSLEIALPSDLLQGFYMSGTTYFLVNLTLQTDKGELVGSYPLTIAWLEPELTIENSTLLIENRNPVPLRIMNSTVYYMNSTAYYGSPLMVEKLILLNETMLPPMGILRETITPKYNYAYVEVFYEYRNQTVRWVGKVQFS
ncbi:MAG: signal peptidase I [Fervidicoccaceae archaeon]